MLPINARLSHKLSIAIVALRQGECFDAIVSVLSNACGIQNVRGRRTMHRQSYAFDLGHPLPAQLYLHIIYADPFGRDR